MTTPDQPGAPTPVGDWLRRRYPPDNGSTHYLGEGDDPGCCAGPHPACTYEAGFREGARTERARLIALAGPGSVLADDIANLTGGDDDQPRPVTGEAVTAAVNARCVLCGSTGGVGEMIDVCLDATACHQRQYANARAAGARKERERIERGVLALQGRAARMADIAPPAVGLPEDFAVVAQAMDAVLEVVRGETP